MDNFHEVADVDWEVGETLAGGSREMAEELLAMLKDALPEHMEEIHTAKSAGNTDAFYKAVHKLHGAACYTPTPRLKAITEAMETKLKKNNNDLDDLLDELEDTVEKIQATKT